MQYVLKLWWPSTISDAWQWRVYDGESHYIGTLFFNRVSGRITHSVNDAGFKECFDNCYITPEIENGQEEILCA